MSPWTPQYGVPKSSDTRGLALSMSSMALTPQTTQPVNPYASLQLPRTGLLNSSGTGSDRPYRAVVGLNANPVTFQPFNRSPTVPSLPQTGLSEPSIPTLSVNRSAVGPKFVQCVIPYFAGGGFIATIAVPTSNTPVTTQSADRDSTNRPQATFAIHMSYPYDPKYDTKELDSFTRFPPEVRNMIWKLSVTDPEIISVEVLRNIKPEKGTKKTKKVNGIKLPKQFTISYYAYTTLVDLNGDYLKHANGEQFFRGGQLHACKESHGVYLLHKPNYITLLKTGHKILFNAEIDTFAFNRRSRFNLHQLCRRQHAPFPIVKGTEQIQRFVFEQKTNNETALALLKEQIEREWKKDIEEVEKALFEEDDSLFVKDKDWTDAVTREVADLGDELRRALYGLSIVNGTTRTDEKTFYFPVTQKQLFGETEEEAKTTEEEIESEEED